MRTEGGRECGAQSGDVALGSCADVEGLGELQRGDGDGRGVELGYWPVDRPFPAVLLLSDLLAVFQISPATYRRKRRSFARFLLDLDAGGLRFNGFAVAEHLRGARGGVSARVFGGKRKSRAAAVGGGNELHQIHS